MWGAESTNTIEGDFYKIRNVYSKATLNDSLAVFI
jgi:hypothetical protein